MTKRDPTVTITRPFRIGKRPDPAQWADDELLTLDEAAALFWPDGPLTPNSLRTAVRDGVLEVANIAGKILTNKAALGRMSDCRTRVSQETASQEGRGQQEPGSVAEMQRRFLQRPQN